MELPTNLNDETVDAFGEIETKHKDIYYMDGCSREESLTVLSRVGDLLYNDGLSSFGFGVHSSGDEIMSRKFNVLTIYSKNIEKYNNFFENHEIEQTDNLITAWDTFTDSTPGISEIYESNGKSVYNIPKLFKEWGMYFAERREDD